MKSFHHFLHQFHSPITFDKCHPLYIEQRFSILQYSMNSNIAQTIRNTFETTQYAQYCFNLRNTDNWFQYSILKKILHHLYIVIRTVEKRWCSQCRWNVLGLEKKEQGVETGKKVHVVCPRVSGAGRISAYRIRHMSWHAFFRDETYTGARVKTTERIYSSRTCNRFEFSNLC